MENSNDISHIFINTENFEIYCFCPIFNIKINNILENKKDIINSKYIFVGGFDIEKREGLIKLYKLLYNKNVDNINIEYIQDIEININDNSESYKRINGPISCIIQSRKTGKILITSYNGKVYLFNKPNIDLIEKYENEKNIKFIF